MATTNPFLALRSYTLAESERLFGRDRDLSLMQSRVLSGRTTLLFAASGVGKTSFLNAKLVPYLSRNFFVCIQREWFKEAPLQSIVRSVIDNLNVLGFDTNGITADNESRLLKHVLSHVSNLCGRKVILVLDQFEELFQYHRNTSTLKEFGKSIAELVNDTHQEVRVMLSMRDEFLGDLSVFDNLIDDPFSNYYRLKNPSCDEAEEIIENTASAVGVSVDGGGLECLVADLASLPSVALDFPGAGSAVIRDYVPPPYLQLACYRLWTLESPAANRPFLASYQKGLAAQQLRTYCDDVLNGLHEDECNLASDAFGFLMTKRGAKMAYELENLSD